MFHTHRDGSRSATVTGSCDVGSPPSFPRTPENRRNRTLCSPGPSPSTTHARHLRSGYRPNHPPIPPSPLPRMLLGSCDCHVKTIDTSESQPFIFRPIFRRLFAHYFPANQASGIRRHLLELSPSSSDRTTPWSKDESSIGPEEPYSNWQGVGRAHSCVEGWGR